MWFLFGLGIWLLGILVYYLLDAWIDYGLVYRFDERDYHGNIIHRQGEPLIGAWIFLSITWPIWVWFVVPGILAKKLHTFIKNKKTKIDKEKENKLKIRIAQEKAVQKEIEKIDEELELSIKGERKTA